MNAAYALVCGARDHADAAGRHPRDVYLEGGQSSDARNDARRDIAVVRSEVQDEALLARIRAGDTPAFEAVYRAHAAALAGFSNAFVHAPDVAEDIVNDVFVRLWEIRAAFHPAAGIRAYLFAAVRNKSLDYLRAERRAEERYRTIALDAESSAASSSPAEDNVEYAEMIAAVQRVIDTFSALRRQILDLRFGQGLSNPEIAEVMGITDQAVRSHVSRAMRDLRAVIPDSTAE